MMRLGHLSDPHLTVPQPRLRDLAGKRLLSYLSWWHRRRRRHLGSVLDTVVADVAAARPDHLAVTGDLTHVGLANEFEEARHWLHGLGEPESVTVIPGNHERLAERGWRLGLGCWRPFLEGDPGTDAGSDDPEAGFPSLRLRGEIALIGLNSAVVTAPGLATGAVGQAQLARLGPLLAATRDRCRVVLVHHSPLRHGHARRKRLTDAAELMAVLDSQGAELVLHGHGHREVLETVVTGWGEMLVAGAPSASLTGAGAAGWNLYQVERAVEGWQVTVELHRTAVESEPMSVRRLPPLNLIRRG